MNDMHRNVELPDERERRLIIRAESMGYTTYKRLKHVMDVPEIRRLECLEVQRDQETGERTATLTFAEVVQLRDLLMTLRMHMNRIEGENEHTSKCSKD